jgi:4-alpha-glucanotransferase
MMERKGGILLPISSLPSRWGIGTLGKEARRFVRFLVDAGQSCWQILPTGPTGYGDSPYQSFSSFAGNPYLIDLDDLCAEGLLEKGEYQSISWGNDPERVDYELLYRYRKSVLSLAVERLLEEQPDDYDEFLRYNEYWLSDYALFMAEKDDHKGKAFREWEEPIRLHKKEALDPEKRRLADQIRYYEGVQYLFRKQWNALREYAHERGISFIGDVPIYVSPDSSDLWGHPELFQLDDHGNMREVSGCPPDQFSASGQLWGNPLYDWEEMAKDSYDWWTRRIAHQFTIVDTLRIDHFRGFESYYAIPSDNPDARGGRWRKGPGLSFFEAVEKKLGSLSIIAEDLGYLTPEVVKLVKDTGYPGMKVLLFAFDTRDTGYGYLPHDYPQNCVVYTGTHDNDTVEGWIKTAPPDCVATAKEYLGLHKKEGNSWGFIRAAYTSVASLAIIPFQDFLGLDNSARINVPSTTGSNWVWRTTEESIEPVLAKRIRRWMELTERLPKEA